jgi:hypothetical protein
MTAKAVDHKVLRGLAEELAGIRADLEKVVKSLKGTTRT